MRIRKLPALVVVPLFSVLAFAQREDAVLTGRVSNAATHSSLEGAVVQVEGTAHSARTERDGTYRLTVPPGSYALAVSYTGLDSQSATVTATAGSTIRKDFGLSAEIYKLSAYTVSGEREGNALALTLQRQAPNVKEVVSADAFGNMAGNPAELLGRLPGIVADSGMEGRYVTIRGIDQTLTTVTMDGNRMANGASAGSTREFQFELVSLSQQSDLWRRKASTRENR